MFVTNGAKLILYSKLAENVENGLAENESDDLINKETNGIENGKEVAATRNRRYIYTHSYQ